MTDLRNQSSLHGEEFVMNERMNECQQLMHEPMLGGAGPMHVHSVWLLRLSASVALLQTMGLLKNNPHFFEMY